MTTTVTVPSFWTFHLACSCPFGSVVGATFDGRILATEQQAWDDFYDGEKRRGNADRKAGVYVTADDEFDTDRWIAGHKHPDCTKPKEQD